MTARAAALLSGVPLDPDADEARELLQRELAQPTYTAAQPTWLDIISERAWHWVRSLFDNLTGEGQWGVWGQLVVILVVVALIVAAFVIFGLPRLRRRAAGEGGALFGDEETRSAAELRAAASTSARAARWNLAVTERYRAIARDLGDRVIVTTVPGMTAQTLAAEASRSFPDESVALRTAARAFDGARYLDETLTAADYAIVSELDARLQKTRPAADPSLASAPTTTSAPTTMTGPLR